MPDHGPAALSLCRLAAWVRNVARIGDGMTASEVAALVRRLEGLVEHVSALEDFQRLRRSAEVIHIKPALRVIDTATGTEVCR